MKATVILAILERQFTDVANSVSWALVRTLKSKQVIQCTDGEGNAVGIVQGITPILQPVPATINGVSSALMFFRAVINSAGSYAWPSSGTFSLGVSGQSPLGTMSVIGYDGGYAISALFVSPLSTAISAQSQTALESYVGGLITSLWTSEPINDTTTPLHLTPGGILMDSREMKATGTTLGLLLVAGSSVANTVGPALIRIKYRQLRGGGVAKPYGNADAGSTSSGAYCSSVQTADGGPKGDGGPGDGDPGPDGDGTYYGSGGGRRGRRRRWLRRWLRGWDFLLLMLRASATCPCLVG